MTSFTTRRDLAGIISQGKMNGTRHTTSMVFPPKSHEGHRENQLAIIFVTRSELKATVALMLLSMSREVRQNNGPIGRLKAVISELDIPNSSVPTSCSLESTKSLAALVDELKIPEEKIGLGAGVLAFLRLYSSIQGFKPGTIVITSELPLGSGLGSSAAFCVALSSALLSFSDSVGLDLSHKEWTSFGESEVDLLNKWAFEGWIVVFCVGKKVGGVGFWIF
ncbi:hypothetical protein ACFX13_030821 [Malus domestica]